MQVLIAHRISSDFSSADRRKQVLMSRASPQAGHLENWTGDASSSEGTSSWWNASFRVFGVESFPTQSPIEISSSPRPDDPFRRISSRAQIIAEAR